MVTDGDNILAAILIIHGPKQTIPVALVESSLLINDKTWSHVINGIVKYEL